MSDDTISRQLAIKAIKRVIWDKQTAKDAIDAVCNIPSTQSEQAIKDCRNCKYGRYNDHWDTYFCYCPNDCNDWDKWEPSTQPSEIQDILNYLDTVLHPIISPEHWNVYSELYDMISTLPSAQLESDLDWRQKHYEASYAQGFVDGCKLYERKKNEENKEMSKVSEMEMAYGEYLND